MLGSTAAKLNRRKTFGEAPGLVLNRVHIMTRYTVETHVQNKAVQSYGTCVYRGGTGTYYSSTRTAAVQLNL